MERKVRSGDRSHKLQDRRELVTLHGNVPSRSLSFLFWNVEGLDVWVESSGKAGHRGPRCPQQGRGGGWRSPAPVTRGSSAQTRCTNTPKLCIIPPEVLVGREGQAWSLSRCSRTGDLERTTAWWRHSTGQTAWCKDVESVRPRSFSSQTHSWTTWPCAREGPRVCPLTSGLWVEVTAHESPARGPSSAIPPSGLGPGILREQAGRPRERSCHLGYGWNLPPWPACEWEWNLSEASKTWGCLLQQLPTD